MMASDKYGLKDLEIGDSKVFNEMNYDTYAVANSAWNYKRYGIYMFSVKRFKDTIVVTRVEIKK